MIEVQNFFKKYEKNSSFAVENVSFSAKKGITCLLGLNGAGKSTIIKALCSIHYATSGKILISDKNGNFFDVKNDLKKINSLIGYIPEVPNLPEKITVSELLYFCAQLHNLSRKEFEQNFQKVVSDCKIEEILNKKIGILSKGFKQRVSFAQALIHDPENLIFDESVSGLDPAQIIQFRNLIKTLSETKTVFISTHLMQEVESLADQILILHQGKLIASGTEESINQKTNSKNIEESFIKLTVNPGKYEK